MKRQHLQKITSGILVFCLMLSFSISSFAAAFTGAYMTTETDPVTGQVTTVIKDVNPTGQTFSGQNVIEMNAYNNAPTLTNNTFNGSTDINPDFTSITSSGNAYNGSVDINYDGLGGTLDSNGDRFQSATVTAESSDISISNGTFNGATTINAQSVSLGSISQMDTLLDQIKKMSDGLFIYYRYIGPQYTTTSGNSYSITAWSGNTVTCTLNSIRCPYISYNSNNHSFSWVNELAVDGNGNTIYGNYRFQLSMWFTGISYSFQSIGAFFTDLWNLLSWPTSYYMYTFTTPTAQTYEITGQQETTSFHRVLLNRFQIIINLLDYYCKHFYEWYYPLDNVLPEYWRYYNTDTAQSEEIGLAGLMYNISWYLGQMYVLQSASESLDNFTDQVEAVTETFEEAEQDEQEIMSSISSGIESFNPDLSELGTFKALGWCSNYLQLVFLRLGTYGTVILIGLLLGVCMQFIGYFRYKT